MSRRPPDNRSAVDPIAERLVDVGRHLREARQQRGEDLYDVADYLRIKPSYLFALEEGDFTNMPGRTYAMGFLRTYADHLGYDGPELVRQLKATGEPDTEAHLRVRQPVAENRLPSLGIVALGLLLAGVAYAGWFAAQSGDDVFTRIKALPGEIGQYAAAMFEDEPAGASTAATNTPDEDGAEPPIETLSAREETATGLADRTTTTATAEPLPPAGSNGARSTATDRSSLVGSSRVGSSGVGSNGVGSNGIASSGVQARELPRVTSPANGIDITSAIAGETSTDARLDADTRNGEDPLASLVLDAEAERRAALRRLDEERPDGGTVGELLASLQATSRDAAGTAAAARDAAGTAAGEDAPPVSENGRVTLLAREAAWIQVQSPGRDYLRSTTLEPGQRFAIPDRTDLALWTGNAGGVEVWVDGQNLGVLGASGAVMRDVTLTPEALRERR